MLFIINSRISSVSFKLLPSWLLYCSCPLCCWWPPEPCHGPKGDPALAVHNLPTIYENYMKNAQSNGKWSDKKNKFKPNFMCTLCKLERLYIANANRRKIPNKRHELVTQRSHYPRNIFSLFFICFLIFIAFTWFS